MTRSFFLCLCIKSDPGVEQKMISSKTIMLKDIVEVMVVVYLGMLYAKFQKVGPCSVRQKSFKNFPIHFKGGEKYDP